MSAAAIGIIRALILPRSGPLGTRIYPYTAEQGTKHPYLLYGRRNGHPEYHMRGEGGLGRATIDIDAFAETYAHMTAIDDLLRATLSGYRGIVVVDGNLSVDVRRIHITGEDEGTVQPRSGSGNPIYRLSKELEVDVFQSIPTH